MEFSFLPVVLYIGYVTLAVIGGVALSAAVLILVVELLSSGILTRWRQ